MRKPSRVSDVIWGVLTIAISGIMLEAGLQEVFAYWAIEVLPVTIGSLGAFASCVLLISGFALAIRMAFSRAAAFAGALSMIAVHLVGWVLGIVGHGGALARHWVSPSAPGCAKDKTQPRCPFKSR